MTEPRLGEAGLGSARLELGSSFTWALVAVLADTLVFFRGEVELGPEAELSLSLASLFTDSVFFTVFFVFFSAGAGAAAEAPDIMASNSSSRRYDGPRSSCFRGPTWKDGGQELANE